MVLEKGVVANSTRRNRGDYQKCVARPLTTIHCGAAIGFSELAGHELCGGRRVTDEKHAPALGG